MYRKIAARAVRSWRFLVTLAPRWFERKFRGLLLRLAAIAEPTTDEAAARLAAIVTSSTDAIVSKTLNGIVTSWNEGAELLFGYSQREMIGQPIRRIIPPGKQYEEDDILARISAGQVVRHYETVCIRKDGRLIDVSVTVSPIRNRAGLITGAAKIARDITREKEAVEIIHKEGEGEPRKREDLEAVLQAIPVAVYIASDFSCQHMSANSQGYELLRLPAGAEVSLSAPPKGPNSYRICSGGRILAPEELPMRRAAASKSAVLGVDVEFCFTDGDKKYAIGNALPLFGPAGEVRGAVGAFLDVTERRRAEIALRDREERLSAALRAGKLGAYDYDPRTGAIEWDETANRLWGLPEGQPVTYELFEAGVHPSDVPSVREAIAASLDPSGTHEYRCEYRVINKSSGAVRWVCAEGHVSFEGETPVRLVGVVQDITDRERLEAERRERQKRDRYFLDVERSLRNTNSAKEAVTAACESIGLELSASFAGVYELGAGGLPGTMLSLWSASMNEPVRAGTFDAAWQSIPPNELFAGETVIVNGAGDGGKNAGDTVIAIGPRLDARAWMLMPLMRNGKLTAFLTVASDSPRRWAENEVALARETIERCWHAVERARAESAVRESEERLRLANEAAGIGTFTIDLDNKCAHYSPELASMLGFPGVQTATIDAALMRVHRDDVSRVRGLYDAAIAGADGGNVKMDFRFVRPGGEVRWMSWIGRAEFRDGPEGRIAFRVAGACLDITDRKRDEERISFLMHEVNHRSKNLLALVQSLAYLTASSKPDDFIRRFDTRLRALAASHDLLFASEWRGVSLEELIRSQLAHFERLPGGRIELSGPAVIVAAATAQALGLALHELSTNAVKYGALSNETGEVKIFWNIEQGEEGIKLFRIGWQERGGPPVAPPVHKGFGSTIMTHMLEQSLDAKIELRYERPGLEWHLFCKADGAVTAG
jgi:PAS domain S-box-containing protein